MTIEDHNLIAKMGDRTLVITDIYGVVAEMLTERYDANEDGIIQKCDQSSDMYKCVIDNLLSDYAADINEEVYNGIVDALEELWKTT